MLTQEPIQPQVAQIAREVDLSWDIAVRAATLLNVNPNKVEALQLVRYTSPLAQYSLHHDHGGFYGKRTEHRPWTMLIFLNDVSAGGMTAFPKLGLEVIPRGGDALVWSNTKADGEVDPDMVHMGIPPNVEGVEKYAVNVWFGGESFATRSKEWGKW
jgi:prolyl 4-hydroxylase